jgi:hypothetical protein
MSSNLWFTALILVPELLEQSLSLVRITMTQEDALAGWFRIWYLFLLLFFTIIICHFVSF